MPISNRSGLVRHFDNLAEKIQPHFWYFKALITTKHNAHWLPLEVSLAYLFYRVELAHRDTIYCGVVRLHRVDADFASEIVQKQHLKREEFRDIFENLFGKPLPNAIIAKLQAAEKIRDKAIHGSSPNDSQMREAIVNVLDYANDYNAFVKSIAGFEPFGDLRGFHGGKDKRLTKATTRLILKGLNLSLN